MMRYKANYDFKPEEADELPFSAGDLIDAPATKTDPNWGTGTNTNTGMKGTFPWSYLDPNGTPVESELPPVPGKTQHSYENFTPTGATQKPGAPSLAPRASMAGQVRPAAQSVSSARSPSVSGGGGGGDGGGDLNGKNYYGGKMKREEVQRVLQNAPDGTFLVRDSTSRDGYSLSVKFQEIRHIVIITRGGKYGFSEPCTFDSTTDLIAYFQKESLAHYNAELETTLAYPFREAPKQPLTKAHSVAMPEEEEEELYIANRAQLRNQLGRKAHVQVQDTEDMGQYIEMKAVEMEQKAHVKMLSMLKDQKVILEQKTGSLQSHDEQSLQKNLKMLRMRLVDSERNLKLIEQQVQLAADQATKRSASMSGGPKKFKLVIDETVDRIKAEAMLTGKEDGTYIIRKSNRDNDPYTLSMIFLNKVRHIQIKYDGTRYGLAEPLAFFSLEDLCKYYADTELSSTITRKLGTPLNKSA